MDLVDTKPSVTRIVGSGSGGRRPDDKFRLVSSKDPSIKTLILFPQLLNVNLDLSSHGPFLGW